MKIGIVTFHDASNYGAALQAYALARVLGQLGAEAEFVALAGDAATNDRGTSLPEGMAKHPALAVRFARIQQWKNARDALFSDFRKRFIRVSGTYARTETEALSADYDLFIAGSDQVWNYEIPGVGENCFLTFAPHEKRWSYAASMGVDSVPEQLRPAYAQWLIEFSRISVRDESTRTLVRELSGRDALLCLDPTLLLPVAEWEKLASAPVPNFRYVLVYMVDYDAGLLAAAQKSAAERGATIKVATASLHFHSRPETWCGVGVTELVALARHAEVFFTNSFHGICLSIIFHRQFCVPDACVTASRGSRIAHLLGSAELNGRIGYANSDAPVDWADVETRLDQQRRTSLAYLAEAVDVANRYAEKRGTP